jgi:hypothetical protein
MQMPEKRMIATENIIADQFLRLVTMSTNQTWAHAGTRPHHSHQTRALTGLFRKQEIADLPMDR